MAFVKTWDETKPAGSRSASLGDDDIREFKYAIRERLAIDHKFVDDETGVTTVGYHLKCTLIESAADPSNVANTGILYTKDSGGITELYYIDSAGTIKQLTSNGKLNITNAEVAGIISGAAQGDIIYLSDATTLTRLAKNTTAERVLCNTGANNNPQWDLLNLANAVEGQLPLANGGSGANLTNDPGGLPYCGASVMAILAAGIAGKYLKSGGAGAPSWEYPVRFYTGTYTGDGAASKAITSVGFTSKLIIAWGQGNVAGVRVLCIKCDQDGNNSLVVSHAANTYNANEMTTIGADGFTVVNTGGYMNVNGETYTFVCITW